MWFDVLGKLPLSLEKYCTTDIDYSPLINFNKKWNFNKETFLKRYSKEKLCDAPQHFVIIDPAGAFEETNFLCKSIGGTLPTSMSAKRYLLSRSSEESISCVNQGTDAISWVYQPLNSVDQESFTSECLAVDNKGNQLYIACVRRLICTLCLIKLHKYTLYGHNGHYFDYMYYIKRGKNGRPIWEGIGGSLAEKQNDTWVLSSNSHKTTWMLQDYVLPAGRHRWTKMDTYATILLSLASCKTWHFACSDGTCIEMHQRCNDVFDCFDRSDENDCTILKKKTTYNAKNVPPPVEEEIVPSPLLYHAEVYNLNDITTHKGEASMDVGITMQWYDPRIELSNLKTKKDKKNYFPCSLVWLPSLMAISGDGNGSVLKTNRYEEFCFAYAKAQTSNRSLDDPFMGKYKLFTLIPEILKLYFRLLYDYFFLEGGVV